MKDIYTDPLKGDTDSVKQLIRELTYYHGKLLRTLASDLDITEQKLSLYLNRGESTSVEKAAEVLDALGYELVVRHKVVKSRSKAVKR